MPDSWPTAYASLQQPGESESARLAIQLALIFDDQQAIEALRTLVRDSDADPQHRCQAIDTLVASRADGLGTELLGLLDDPAVRQPVLRGLAWFDSTDTAAAIIARYGQLSSAGKQLVLQTLSVRQVWARPLLEAIASGTIPASDVTALTAGQLHSLGVEQISRRLGQLWGNVRATPKISAQQIESLSRTLTAEVLAGADLVHGEILFKKHCGNCHRFFGEGGQVGPDLTAAQCSNLGYLLENIVDPTASVANEFRMRIVRTIDGRVLSGLVESENERVLTLVNATDRIVLPRDEIEDQQPAAVSIMPSGLLDPLSEREIRDLFGYLQR